MISRARVTVVLVLLALLVGAIGVAGAGAARSPFTGVWTSIDSDGSSQVMMISGGQDSHRLTLMDDEATLACSAFDDSPALAQGFGTEAGFELSGTWDVYCLTPARVLVFDDAGFLFTYHPSTDTLTDDIGPATVTWHRLGGPPGP